MRRRIRIQPWWVMGGVLVLLFIVLLITYSTEASRSITADEGATPEPSQSVAENAAGNTLSPLMRWTHSAAAGIRDFFGRLFGVRDIDREYEQLRQQVARQELESAWIQEVVRENTRLTGLLGYARQYPQYQYCYAKVIARDPDSWYSTLLIDCGVQEGIAVNMAVVTQDGLLGRVIEVTNHSATVLTIIDRQSAVAVVLERSRDGGVLKGATDQESSEPFCSLYYLPFGADLVPGDRLLSSGMGGYYPKGIPVGEVVEVSRQSNLQSYAVITPYVDFARVEDVLVITGETPSSVTPAPGGEQGGEEGIQP